ncbi:MAG: hypothetical protein ACK5TR_04600 [Alphaproteobacteria bacterium]|jgi:hypothetical protein
MQTIVSRLALLMTGASLACFAPAKATDSLEENQKTTLSHLPHELISLVIGQLPPNTFAQSAEVSKTWKLARDNILPDVIKNEARFVLHDAHEHFSNLPKHRQTEVIDSLLHRDGFALVPFGCEYFPAKTLCDHDVEEILPKLYAHAFGEEKTVLSQQDRLCLEAVLPWSRMVITDDPKAKADALDFLTNTVPNPGFLRFSSTLDAASFTQAEHTLILTNDELSTHKASLFRLVWNPSFGTHNLSLHLVVNPNRTRIRDGHWSMAAMEIPLVFRHKNDRLILSDPKKAVRTLGQHFLSHCDAFMSLCIRDLGAVTHVEDCAFKKCAYLEFLDLRGLRSVKSVGAGVFFECHTLSDGARRKLRHFYQGVEENPQGLIKTIEEAMAIHYMNPKHYLLYNPDVRNAAEEKGIDPKSFAVTHFAGQGFKEARRAALPGDFFIETYFYLNPDVEAYAHTLPKPEKFGIFHFITHAQKENRLYRFDLPSSFTSEEYLKKNPDLQEYAKSESEAEQDMKLKAHYTRHGQYEGRPF